MWIGSGCDEHCRSIGRSVTNRNGFPNELVVAVAAAVVFVSVADSRYDGCSNQLKQ